MGWLILSLLLSLRVEVCGVPLWMVSISALWVVGPTSALFLSIWVNNVWGFVFVHLWMLLLWKMFSELVARVGNEHPYLHEVVAFFSKFLVY